MSEHTDKQHLVKRFMPDGRLFEGVGQPLFMLAHDYEQLERELAAYKKAWGDQVLHVACAASGCQFTQSAERRVLVIDDGIAPGKELVAQLAAEDALACVPSHVAPITEEFKEFIGRLADLAHTSSFWEEKPYSNRLYYGIGGGDYIARDILQAFLHALKSTPSAIQTGKAEYGPSDVELEVANIANAKRFDRQMFRDDTEFADWAQSRCRHLLRSSDSRSDGK